MKTPRPNFSRSIAAAFAVVALFVSLEGKAAADCSGGHNLAQYRLVEAAGPGEPPADRPAGVCRGLFCKQLPAHAPLGPTDGKIRPAGEDPLHAIRSIPAATARTSTGFAVVGFRDTSRTAPFALLRPPRFV